MLEIIHLNLRLKSKMIKRKRIMNNYNTMREVNADKNPKKAYDEIFDESEHGKFLNIEVNNSSIDELYEKFKIKKGESDFDRVKDLDMKSFESIYKDVKQAEVKLYAFLNKEFNILNKKYLQCCFNCYGENSTNSLVHAKTCTEECQLGIKEAKIYTENVQRLYEEKLKMCIDNTKDFSKMSKDSTMTFVDCYRVLIDDMQKGEQQIKIEFSNYI